MLTATCSRTRLKKDVMRLMRRKNGRVPCRPSLAGSIFLPQAGKTLDVCVIDLSSNGIAVMTAEKVDVGQDVIVNLKRTTEISMIPFPAQVLHVIKESKRCFRIG